MNYQCSVKKKRRYSWLCYMGDICACGIRNLQVFEGIINAEQHAQVLESLEKCLAYFSFPLYKPLGAKLTVEQVEILQQQRIPSNLLQRTLRSQMCTERDKSQKYMSLTYCFFK